MAGALRFRNAALLYNPLAGRRRERRLRDLARAIDLLAAHDLSVTLVATTGPGSGSELTRRELGDGRDLVIVCGGDGTINEVVNGMVGSQVPLAILPAGTGNVLAKELGLPWNIWRAAEYIPAGVVRRIALGRAASPELGERHFIAVAGAGADANLIYRLSQKSKLSLGMLSFWLEGFRQLFRYDFREFMVQADGQGLPATLVVVGRTRHYGGPIEITRRASLFADDFEVAVFPQRPRPVYLLYLLAQWVGWLERFPGVRFVRAGRVVARPFGSERVYAQADGELLGPLPVEFTLVPDALSLLVPAALPADH
ncbi:MAG: diacylglycerol/lipid kinase family protein [Candidatus Acidiferrales bacterium]